MNKVKEIYRPETSLKFEIGNLFREAGLIVFLLHLIAFIVIFMQSNIIISIYMTLTVVGIWLKIWDYISIQRKWDEYHEALGLPKITYSEFLKLKDCDIPLILMSVSNHIDVSYHVKVLNPNDETIVRLFI